MVLPPFLKFSLIYHEYANKIMFILDHKMKVLSNYINDDIKTCNNCGLMMVWGLNQLFMFFMIFPINLRILLIFMNMQIR